MRYIVLIIRLCSFSIFRHLNDSIHCLPHAGVTALVVYRMQGREQEAVPNGRAVPRLPQLGAARPSPQRDSLPLHRHRQGAGAHTSLRAEQQSRSET